MMSCLLPAEKIILPMWPAPPLRSSALSSGSAFIALTDSVSISMSPSGVSTLVQKNSRPPMSDAPSSSTPFLPPSLIAAFICLSRALAASLAAFSASSGAAAAAAAGFLSSLPPAPPPFLSSLPPPLPLAPPAGAAAATTGGFSYTCAAEWSAQLTSSSGENHSAISPLAASTPSEPWQRLRPTSRQKSPRIVPGSDSAGLVAPSILRPIATALRPSQTMGTTGPLDMYSTSPGKKGLLFRSA
mmetsp:Transcript_17278/g.53701  ORF Transcript_17278/g.53701 Transcript_17278/m.53701 type:complete len:243 (-) Transcript_17278:199-927(-)